MPGVVTGASSPEGRALRWSGGLSSEECIGGAGQVGPASCRGRHGACCSLNQAHELSEFERPVT